MIFPYHKSRANAADRASRLRGKGLLISRPNVTARKAGAGAVLAPPFRALLDRLFELQ